MHLGQLWNLKSVADIHGNLESVKNYVLDSGYIYSEVFGGVNICRIITLMNTCICLSTLLTLHTIHALLHCKLCTDLVNYYTDKYILGKSYYLVKHFLDFPLWEYRIGSFLNLDC